MTIIGPATKETLLICLMGCSRFTKSPPTCKQFGRIPVLAIVGEADRLRRPRTKSPPARAKEIKAKPQTQFLKINSLQVGQSIELIFKNYVCESQQKTSDCFEPEVRFWILDSASNPTPANVKSLITQQRPVANSYRPALFHWGRTRHRNHNSCNRNLHTLGI